MFHFKTRDAARAFAARTGRSVIDTGAGNARSRWAVQVVS